MVLEETGGQREAKTPKIENCWFILGDKYLDISIVLSRGILGFHSGEKEGKMSWLKFQVQSSELFLEGLENWCRQLTESRGARVWNEGIRSFR